ncbi:SGNH/GDSL hydrolase family protein [Alsobacter sp. KACC 23698]|uniref:SGNH/GDSL hydrolase family protein n=1 Tax=Alsobacter sp. KACC 23698 TaxID=3149229 RepID=A0AAU7JL03_9HYPH
MSGSIFRVAAFAAGLFAAIASPLAASAAETPCQAPGLSRALHADAITRRLKQSRPVSILAIGSSSTEGVGASAKDRSYPATLEHLLQRTWPTARIRVDNAGVGGETAGATLQRLKQALAGPAYSLVIWQVGTNDAVKGDDEAAFRSMLESGIAMAREAKVELVIVDQQLFPGIKDMPRYERYVAAVSDVAGRNDVAVFSRFQMMRTWAADGREHLEAALSADAFHMNDRGYECLAQGLAAPIRQAVGPGVPVPVATVGDPSSI